MFHFILSKGSPPFNQSGKQMYWQKGWILNEIECLKQFRVHDHTKDLSDTGSTRGAHPCETFFGETLNPLIVFCSRVFLSFRPVYNCGNNCPHLQLSVSSSQGPIRNSSNTRIYHQLTRHNLGYLILVQLQSSKIA